MFPKSSKQIGDNQYTVSALPAHRSRKLLLKLIKTLGPSIQDRDGKLHVAVSQLCEQLDESLFDEVVDTFAGVTLVNDDTHLGNKPLFDKHFAAKAGEMMLWLRFALESEYGSFLDVLRAAEKSESGGSQGGE